jgi:hypothetical protein
MLTYFIPFWQLFLRRPCLTTSGTKSGPGKQAVRRGFGIGLLVAWKMEETLIWLIGGHRLSLTWGGNSIAEDVFGGDLRICPAGDKHLNNMGAVFTNMAEWAACR